MKSIPSKLSMFALSILTTVIVSQSSSAHMVEPQHGTVNIVDDGAYVIVSFPVSAFEHLDADQDGVISMLEFNNKRTSIVELIRNELHLIEGESNVELTGIMLSPEFAHGASQDDVAQITLLGKFALKNSANALTMVINLYSDIESKQKMKIKATRKADNLEQEIELTPDNPSRKLVPALTLS